MRQLCGLLLLAALPAWAQPGHPEDAAFRAARDAYAKGAHAALERALAGLDSHPLKPWAEYFRLSLALEDGRDAGVTEFIERHDGSYLAEKMRGDRLKWLIRQEDWHAAHGQFARLQRPDMDASCLDLEARLRLDAPAATGDARQLLVGATSLPEPCRRAMGRLAAEGALPADEVWARLRRLTSADRLPEARVATAWLPTAENVSARSLERIAAHPARHLAQLPKNFSASRRERELAKIAVLRLARTDVHVAAARWTDIEARFDDAERAPVWARLALRAALDHQPEAGAWFARAEELGANLDVEERQWRVRAALRAADWTAVLRGIAALPGRMAVQPEWIYWRARAHAATGQALAAQAGFSAQANQSHFYGILSAEALGRPLVLPPVAPPPGEEEIAAIAALPEVQRALALLRNDLRNEGLREWSWALSGLNDRQLLAAATHAQRVGVIDRAINAADRTRAEHDFRLRYPAPFAELVEARAEAVDLDPAWVYGLMRQESRFAFDARSSAGASGLMQLMPKTARWVAHRIGMKDYRPSRVNEMDTNVTLGTHYLRMALDKFNGQALLATAAYNAGPGRARKWRAERPLEGALYAETIPYNETRDYVKRVMANAMHYALLLDRPTLTLTQRLGTVGARDFADGTVEDLP